MTGLISLTIEHLLIMMIGEAVIARRFTIQSQKSTPAQVIEEKTMQNG